MALVFVTDTSVLVDLHRGHLLETIGGCREWTSSDGWNDGAREA
jgi:hypothetical protein